MCTLVVQWTTRSHSIEAGSTQRAAADEEGTMHAAVRVWRVFAQRDSKDGSDLQVPRDAENPREGARSVRCL
jgi:hypothetical protein